MRYFLLILFFSVFVAGLKAQNQTIKGIVVDADGGLPLDNVLIFVPNSSISTVSDINGQFSITVPNYVKEIAFEQSGFETKVIPISNITPKISMSESKVLDDVIAVSYDPKNWPTDLQYFTDNFIGRGEEAEKVKIKEPKKSLKFYLNNSEQYFKAYGKEVIRIENKFLGYELNYTLLNFTSNFKTKNLNYQGFVLFKPMKGSKRQQKKWKLNRRLVYMGSLQHFSKSLFQNTYKEEGFVMNNLVRKRNPDYPSDSVIQQMKSDIKLGLVKPLDAKFRAYSKKMLLSKYVDYLLGETNRDSILLGNGNKKSLQFKDYIYVQYKPKTNVYKSNTSIISQLDSPIYIYDNGYIENDVLLMLEGDWSLDKVAKLLPINYDPNE